VPKVTMSFAKIRKHLLKQMTSKSADKKTGKVLRFPNEDVPTFLRNLDEFEEKSKKSSAMIR
jgi:hypothetical protein